MNKVYKLLTQNKKSILTIILLLTLLISTQFMFPINFTGRTLYIYSVEMIIIALCLISFVDILKNKKQINFNKKLIILSSIFVLWFLILTICRFVLYKNITGGFIVFRVIFFPCCIYFLLKQYEVNKQDLIRAFIMFMLVVNFKQIYNLLFVNNSFRGLNALQNINIYLCFSNSLIPIFLLAFKKLDNVNNLEKYIFKSLIFFNLILIIIFSLLSGSRIGIIMCPFIFTISYFLINKINLKAILNYVIFGITVMLLIFTITKYEIYDSLSTINRATDSVNKILAATNDKSDKETIEEDDNEIQTNSTVVDSNNMRSLIWKNSIKSVLDSPLLGKPSIDIEFEMHYANLAYPVKMVQSPHNFILEMWLAFGLPGLMLYLSSLLYVVITILKSKILWNYKFNFLLSMFAIFGFSFFQPLVTCYFVISLTLWFIIYIYEGDII